MGHMQITMIIIPHKCSLGYTKKKTWMTQESSANKNKEWCSQANVFQWVKDENGITLEYFNLRTNTV
jgi:hypothetical protein